jgi:hypothetical protein
LQPWQFIAIQNYSGLKHRKEEALQLPSAAKAKKKPVEVLPDNIVTTKTGIFKVQASEDSTSWERVQDKKQASVESLTPKDLQGLQDKKLNKDLVRAANFKRIWCSKISAKEASKVSGLSVRTMEKYWSIFNKQ